MSGLFAVLIWPKDRTLRDRVDTIINTILGLNFLKIDRKPKANENKNDIYKQKLIDY